MEWNEVRFFFYVFSNSCIYPLLLDSHSKPWHVSISCKQGFTARVCPFCRLPPLSTCIDVKRESVDVEVGVQVGIRYVESFLDDFPYSCINPLDTRHIQLYQPCMSRHDVSISRERGYAHSYASPIIDRVLHKGDRGLTQRMAQDGTWGGLRYVSCHDLPHSDIDLSLRHVTSSPDTLACPDATY